MTEVFRLCMAQGFAAPQVYRVIRFAGNQGQPHAPGQDSTVVQGSFVSPKPASTDMTGEFP